MFGLGATRLAGVLLAAVSLVLLDLSVPRAGRAELRPALFEYLSAFMTSHRPKPKDMSVCAELKKVKPDIFAQGGDRNAANIPPCEVKLQKEIGFKIVSSIGRGGKVQSSSWLLAKHAERAAGKHMAGKR